MNARQAADLILDQEQEIKALHRRVKGLEDGLRRIVTCGNEKASAMAWNILNEVSVLDGE